MEPYELQVKQDSDHIDSYLEIEEDLDTQVERKWMLVFD